MGQRKAAASFWENGEERAGAACGQLYKRVIHIGVRLPEYPVGQHAPD